MKSGSEFQQQVQTRMHMTRTKWKIVVSLFTAMTLACVPAVSQSKPQNVVVVNGTGQPVPAAAQGTTNVAGTVGLAAGSTVNISNTPTVRVGNTPSVTVPTRRPSTWRQVAASTSPTRPTARTIPPRWR